MPPSRRANRVWCARSASRATVAQVAATHRRSLKRFDFDSVLLPCNFVTLQSAYYREGTFTG